MNKNLEFYDSLMQLLSNARAADFTVKRLRKVLVASNNLDSRSYNSDYDEILILVRQLNKTVSGLYGYFHEVPENGK